MDRSGLRASDADRERAVELLQGHAEAGRLTVEELDERCSRALSAKTFGELDAITSDLPPLAVLPEAPPPAAGRPARGRRRGRYFSGSWRVPAGPERAMRDLFEQVVPQLEASGYRLHERGPYRLRLVRTRRPVWTFALAILVFPFGLLALLYTEERHVAIELQPTEAGTVVTAAGVAPPELPDAFRRLEG